jgi:hypothetical protein
MLPQCRCHKRASSIIAEQCGYLNKTAIIRLNKAIIEATSEKMSSLWLAIYCFGSSLTQTGSSSMLELPNTIGNSGSEETWETFV